MPRKSGSVNGPDLDDAAPCMETLPGLTADELDRAAEVVERLWAAASTRFAWVRVPALALRHHRLLTELSKSLHQLPSVRVQPSEDAAGRELTSALLGPQRRPEFARRDPSLRVRLGGRLLRVPDRRAAVAVLAVPRDPAEYITGHKRQALRTNLAHARKQRLVVREITDGAEQLDCVKRVLDAREDRWLDDYRDWLQQVVDAGLVRVFAGFAPDGTVLTVSVVISDPPWALLRLFVSVEGKLSSYSRYATHACTVEALSKSGIHTLLVDTVFDAPPGVRYFQARLGFELANITVG